MIVAFGNPVYDDIQTPSVSTGSRVLSGCSTNGCIMLAHLGHPTALVGMVGADYHDRLLADLRRFAIEPHVQICAQTGGFRLIYDARGDRTLDVLGVADPIEQVPESCAAARAVIIGPILQETPAELIERLAQSTDAPLMLDPQGLLRRIRPDGRIEHVCPPEFAQIAPRCRVIKANEVEARVITGIDPREDGATALARLKALGCAIAIITLAEAGSLIDDGRERLRIPAYATDARDPTGAGDTYMAGLVDAYLRDPSDLYAAGCRGAAAASTWIEHTGPDAPISAQEINRRTVALLELPRSPL
ncbi:MAG TPA: PfkB family carbohydrate kinase [Roseiflexaceae bacterium]|nr:PfkB family carbohydrate kinase [Roseiflexaceae bacterium]